MASTDNEETPRKDSGFYILQEQSGSDHASENKKSGISSKIQLSAIRNDDSVALITSKLSNLTARAPQGQADVLTVKKSTNVINSGARSPAFGEANVAPIDKVRDTPTGVVLPLPIGTKSVVMPKLDAGTPPANSYTNLSTPVPSSKASSEGKLSPTVPANTPASIKADGKENLTPIEELERLKRELAAAKGKIAAMDQELNQQRITGTNLDALLRSPGASEANFDANSFSKPQGRYHQGYMSSDTMSTDPSLVTPSDGTSATWEEARTSSFSYGSNIGGMPHPIKTGWNASIAPPQWTAPDPRLQAQPSVPAQFPLGPPAHRPANLRLEGFAVGPQPYGVQTGGNVYENGFRRGPPRPGSAMGGYNNTYSYSGSGVGTPVHVSPPMTPMHSMMPVPAMPYQQQHPIGTPLSPTASEFTRPASSMNNYPIHNNNMMNSAWNGQSAASEAGSANFVPPMEPMNYRRLLDRNSNCDWKYIVDKIVCSNDQQASIFLQQKLKIAPSEQKFDLIESIIGHSYPLMINRFGNFLIQRCLEHGTNEQIVAIAGAIHGNVLNLSMDAFGCHVVQKALDVVPEDIKASMVRELLHRIPETVVHRYACHVWQKLFELRWTGTPPQVMKHVNEALRGMWHEVALGETGSLVVQNIFENCLEEDKRPCINEVLASIDLIAHGQFGNWCIQHICEHGLPADRSRAVEHVLRFANEYSTDQFASKVVEKCLKVGGPEFIDRYLERVCEGRPDRPRMPLIDIAGDQYGNYLVQFVLINASPHHREIVSTHIRKHMVSLRGSKFGSRVAMLCTNPNFSTRTQMNGPMNNRFMNNNNNNMGMMGGGMRPPMQQQYR